MQDLKFRKKRRRHAKKKQNRKKKQGLRFEAGKNIRFDKKMLSMKKQSVSAAVKWGIQIAVVCIFAFGLVWFFGQRISNAGDSMKPVLKNGDIVLVDRLVYNAVLPKRGDIVAFKPDGNKNTHYSIKRIVGLPGETVQIKKGSVYINGDKTQEHIFSRDIKEAGVADKPVKLGSNEYFVLGDNHASSDDSRMADIGNVKRDEIYGRIWFVASFGSDFGFVKR